MKSTNLETLAELADEFNAEGRYYTDKVLACGRKKISVVHHRYIEEHINKATWEMLHAIESRNYVGLSVALHHENRVFNTMIDYLTMQAQHNQINVLGKDRTKMLVALRKCMTWFYDGEEIKDEIGE